MNIDVMTTMEPYDSNTEIHLYDNRIYDKTFMQFLEDCIKEYLHGPFIVLKENYKSEGIHWVNYSTIYAKVKSMMRYKVLIDKTIDSDAVTFLRCDDTEHLCCAILNKFVRLHRLHRNDSFNIGYEYIFISVT